MNLKLFALFFQISLYSFGGIYSIWALTQKKLVTECKVEKQCEREIVFKQEDFDRIFGISRMIPGPRVGGIAMLGYPLGGVFTMLAILLGLLAPSLLIVPLITKFYNRLSHKENVKNIRKGAQIAIISILAVFLYGLLKKGFRMEWVQSIFYIAIAGSVFWLNKRYRINPVILIVASIIAGYLLLNASS
ncbi:MAG: chromate transporter [Leptospirales bacterium]